MLRLVSVVSVVSAPLVAAFVSSSLAWALFGCAHAPPPDPLDALATRDVHARWSIVDRPAPPDALDWHNPIGVSLVVDGQVIDAAQGTSCKVSPLWVGKPRPLSNVHCTFMGPGESNVGVFRDGDALVVREQDWGPTDVADGPPTIHESEVGRIVVPANKKVVFDAP